VTHASDIAHDPLAPDEAPSESEILADALAHISRMTQTVDATIADAPVAASDVDEPAREELALEAKRIEQSLTRLRYWLLRERP